MKTTRFALFSLFVFLLLTGPAWAADGSPEPETSAEPSAVSEAGGRILELVNRERAAAGLESLALDQEAMEIAGVWARHMAMDGRISHNEAYVSDETMRRLDAVRVGENVAVASSVDEIHDLFMHSPKHRENILEPGYRLIGVGAFRADSGQLFLTEDFLTRQPAPPPAAETKVTASAPAPAPAPPRPRPAPPAPPAPPATTNAAQPAPAAAAPAPAPSPAPPMTASPLIPSQTAATPDSAPAPESLGTSEMDPVRGSHRQPSPLNDLLKGAPGLALLHRRAARRYC